MKADLQIRANVRTGIIRQVAIGNAKDFGTENVFRESQVWNGFTRAFESWELAFWKWVDGMASPEMESEWRSKLFADKARYTPPGSTTEPDLSVMEAYLQSYLFRRAVFLKGLEHKKDTSSKWFKGFADYFAVAKRLDDDAWFKELARLTRRKTSQDDKGKRSLPYWLLNLWISGCFWASTNNGMSNFLIHQELSSAYADGTLRNQIATLELFRLSKPRIFGIGKTGKLIAL